MGWLVGWLVAWLVGLVGRRAKVWDGFRVGSGSV